MSFTLKTTISSDDAVNFIALSILNQLKLNKHVLFFATGGSSISVGVKVAELIKDDKSINNLTVMLTDERYGPLNHINSNWYQLIQKGFNLPGAVLIPILIGEDITKTTKKFNTILNQELKIAEYKIGLFGIGKDGHTAGILPESIAVHCKDFACSYEAPPFSRITITPEAIKKLDEAVVWIQGQEKWQVVKDLIEDNIPARPHEGSGAGGNIIKQPAQILKKVPLLTIFTDYTVE